jgi:hypothetical protein
VAPKWADFPRFKKLKYENISLFSIRDIQSQDSSVGITPENELNSREIRVRLPSGATDIVFLFTTVSRPALGPTDHPIQWGEVAGV